jgi:hypothetical protein
MSQKSVSIAGAVLIAFAVGAVIGWFCADASPSHQASPLGRRLKSKPNAPPAMANSPVNSSIDSDRKFNERLDKALVIRSKFKRERAIAAIADGLDSQQIRDALEEAQRTYIPEREAILMALFSRWGELEPESAMAYARQVKDEFIHRAIVEVAKAWARRDFDAAFAATRNMPIGELRQNATSGVLQVLSETDPVTALELAKQTATVFAISETLFKNWVERNPEEAASYAVKLPAGNGRDHAIASVAHKWATIDPHGMLRWVESLPDSDAIGNSGWNSTAASLFLSWADEDPEAALRWLEQMPEGSRRAGIVSRINSESAYRLEDPEIFNRLITLLPPGRQRNDAWGNFMNWWGEADVSAAIAWAQSQPPELQEVTIPSLARTMSSSNHLAALELASTLPEKLRNDVTEDIVGWWAIKDPAAAAKWLEQIPANAAQLKGIAVGWISKDIARAADWVNKIDPGPIKDEMLTEVVERIEKDNPKLACVWIEGISDEKKRQAAYKQLGEWWAYQDPAAASAWLESSSIPETLKNEILGAIKK